ncbi:hypothetical protein NDU88_005699 [Pleurodeles waltl]|uniref:Uncharacterized protein n=1 Tax=Pleurodeles waltl TaxID=8319 RepID=A0AAV7WZE5_PLEWA|nr:hypothetical protein NDU88_005699 [Pleurodeles waltl]
MTDGEGRVSEVEGVTQAMGRDMKDVTKNLLWRVNDGKNRNDEKLVGLDEIQTSELQLTPVGLDLLNFLAKQTMNPTARISYR